MPIQVEGVAELTAVLQDESVRTAKRYLMRVAQPAADVVIEAMQETAPEMTTALEAGIGSQSKFSDTGLTVLIGPAWATFWGAFQEFGSAHLPALHWMTRAWESSQAKCLDVFQTEAVGLLMDLENKGK
jgi:HK97 gp10 family phage protein